MSGQVLERGLYFWHATTFLMDWVVGSPFAGLIGELGWWQATGLLSLPFTNVTVLIPEYG